MVGLEEPRGAAVRAFGVAPSSRIARPPRARATLAALAGVAFVTAAVGHEAIGHGGACLAAGGRVTLLTSVYFRCSDGVPAVDAAAPLMNLVMGAAFWAMARGRPAASASRMFFVLAMAFNLFWGAGYFVFSSVTNRGDWAFVLRGLALEPRWLWRALMGILGLFLYVRFLRAIAACAPAGLPFAMAWLVAGTISCLAALCYPGPTLPALREAAQEGFGAAVGLLFLARWQSARSPVESPAAASISTAWLIVCAAIVVLFVLLFGRGVVAPAGFL